MSKRFSVCFLPLIATLVLALAPGALGEASARDGYSGRGGSQLSTGAARSSRALTGIRSSGSVGASRIGPAVRGSAFSRRDGQRVRVGDRTNIRDRRVTAGRALGYGDRGRGWRDLERPRSRYETRGSFLAHRNFREPEFRERGVDAVILGDLATLGAASYEELPSFPSDTKIIDLESERLDRRALKVGEIEVTYTGGAKIIRIGREQDGSTRGRARPVSARPSAEVDLQPWSAGWLRQCNEAHLDFDPELGTYTDRAGRVRFCDGR